MERYALAEHVFVCVDDGQVVLLDVRQDRYWALEAARTAGLGTLVAGWPVARAQCDTGARGDEPNPCELGAVLELLCGRGLLTEPNASGKDATPVRAHTPVTDFGNQLWATKVVGSSRTVTGVAGSGWTFLLAAVRARIALRLWPFERIIGRVRRRKLARAGRTQALDAELTRDLVAAFVRRRVFLFSSRNECLHDSLALLEFLARYGLYPDWVFGVQTRPFAAHCWVQQDGVVLNDSLEHVIGYTPIMVV